jgi:hypothetical protein
MRAEISLRPKNQWTIDKDERLANLDSAVSETLKNNLPELFAAAQQRFPGRPPQQVFSQGQDRVGLRDAGDFDPWETL